MEGSKTRQPILMFSTEGLGKVCSKEARLCQPQPSRVSEATFALNQRLGVMGGNYLCSWQSYKLKACCGKINPCVDHRLLRGCVCNTQAKQICCCELWTTGMSFLWNLGQGMCVGTIACTRAEELFQLHVREAAPGGQQPLEAFPAE